MKKFEIPNKYRSTVIGSLKEWRRLNDPRKKDFSPEEISIGPVTFIIPRHMGFCYGVENAIEISYKAISENPERSIYLLSQMIHNPAVNADLESAGVRFIQDTEGNQLIDWDSIHEGDIVIIPAFGASVELEELLVAKGVDINKYNTTCPFVEKVWKRSSEIGEKGYSVVIHGKYKHEETRATFSHSYQNAPSVIIRDMDEAKELAKVIVGEYTTDDFQRIFKGKYSNGFDPSTDLKRVGVVNQTTMLATETQEIADFLRETIAVLNENGSFADTRDTLCYATNDNQSATRASLGQNADFALVIGGFNSSNTAQLVSILELEMPVFFISGENDIWSEKEIHHFDYPSQNLRVTNNWLPEKEKVRIVLTGGASSPDALMEGVLRKVVSLFGQEVSVENVVKDWVVER